MLRLILLSVFVAGPALACPKAIRQARWADVRVGLQGQGVTIEGTIWDRDRNGKPSNGDLMRIDAAARNGMPLTLEETWVVLKGDLAAGFARRMGRTQPKPSCEVLTQVDGVPDFKTDRALARYLRKMDPDPADLPPKEAAYADMTRWAGELCKAKRHISESDLAKRLEANAVRRHRKVRRRTLQAMSKDVAADYALECAHLTVPATITF
ncbi:MAG: hypothetical protein KC620_17960 [Myxococcales bacterium]|nr:hypothetical protein [Myxococcales bacterium]